MTTFGMLTILIHTIYVENVVVLLSVLPKLQTKIYVQPRGRHYSSEKESELSSQFPV